MIKSHYTLTLYWEFSLGDEKDNFHEYTFIEKRNKVRVYIGSSGVQYFSWHWCGVVGFSLLFSLQDMANGKKGGEEKRSKSSQAFVEMLFSDRSDNILLHSRLH